MADGLQVDTDLLRQGGQSLAQLGEELQGMWSRFSAQVEAMGDIFGDDDVGGLIGMGYQAAHQIAADSYASAVDGFGGFGRGLASMADSYDEVEADITDLLGGIY